jgi:hypothetical protein
MKAKFFSLVVMLFMVASLQSQSIFTENFNYTAGDSIGAHGWTSFSGGATNVLKVVSPGLTYTNYPLSNIGNACRVSSTGQDSYKNTTGDSVTSGSFYVAFMVKVDTAKTGDYFMAMLPPSSTTNYYGRIFVKDSTGSLSFGISKYATTSIPATYGPNGLLYGTTYLVIAKYKFNASTTDDEVSLFVFTSPNVPLTEPGTPYIAAFTTTAADVSSLGRIALRQGTASSAPSLTIDGIQVGLSWASLVTGIRNISSVATDFSLSQNYPNPFNPSTTINFSIPKSGFVTLKVYDVNGREVKSLVNSNMTAGKYEVNANFASLNSGVYFYTINVSGDANYSQTKKLMLVK